MSTRTSLSKTRWIRIDSSTQRLSRVDNQELWKLQEKLKIDPKTKQRIEFQCKIALVKQIKLRKGELMDKSQLDAMVERYPGSKQPKYKLYCLNDQLRFVRIKSIGSGPFRNSVHYTDIKIVSVGMVRPEMFAIYVDEPGRNRRTCEVYQCSEPNHVEQILQVLRRPNQPADRQAAQQMSDAQSTTTSDLLRSPESDTNEYPTGARLPRLSFDANDLPEGVTDRNSVVQYLTNERAGSQPGQQQEQQQQPEWQERRESQFSQINLNVDAVVINKPRASSHQLGSLSEKLQFYHNETNNNSAMKETVTVGTEFSPIQLDENGLTSDEMEWDQYVTYLEPHPVHGARIANRGPIYLFAMRVEKDAQSVTEGEH